MQFRSLYTHELPAWFDLVTHVFTDTSRIYFMNHWYEDPYRELAGILVAVTEEGQIVSTVRIFHRYIHVGGVLLKMGGIGEVCTHPNYQQRGLSGRLLQEAVNYMHRNGFALSVLFTGRVRHYQRYGWESITSPGLCLTNFKLDNMTNVHVRLVNCAEDLFPLVDIYQQVAATLAGPVQRQPEYWWSYIHRQWQEMLVAERAGRLVGYMSASYNPTTQQVRVREFGCLPGEGICAPILLQAVCAKMSVSENSSVIMPLAVDHICAGVLSAAGATNSVTYGAPMYRVITPLALAEQMQAIWQQRLHAAGWHGRVRLHTGIGGIILDHQDGHLAIFTSGPVQTEVQLTQQQFLTALLLGYRVAGIDIDVLSSQGKELLTALFPAIDHVIWPADGF